MDHRIADDTIYRASQPPISHVGLHLVRHGLIGEEGLCRLYQLLDLVGDLLDGHLAQTTGRQVAAPPLGIDHRGRFLASKAEP